MSAEHPPALRPASARKILCGLRHIIAELDELARGAPTRWAERITWITITAEEVAGGIETELIEDGSAAAREASLPARVRCWQADMPGLPWKGCRLVVGRTATGLRRGRSTGCRAGHDGKPDCGGQPGPRGK